MSLSEISLLIVVLLGSARSIRAIWKGHFFPVAVSSISIAVYVFCLWLPLRYQLTGELTSKLTLPGFLNPPDEAEAVGLYRRWALELAIVIIGEVVAGQLSAIVSRKLNESSLKIQGYPLNCKWLRAERVTMLLLVVGAVAVLSGPSGNSVDRGSSEQGIAILLRSCLTCAIALSIYFRHFGKKRYVVVSLLATTFLISQGIRSPLLVLFFAFIISRLDTNLRVDRRPRIVRMATLSLMVALVASFMSLERANESRNYGLTTAEMVTTTLRHPILSPLKSGVDTLDGYRFSRNLYKRVAPSYWEPLTIITTFVPRSLWPSKPGTVAVAVSQKYLGYKASGQFLSPVGYLLLVTGNYFASIFVLGLLSVTTSLLVRRVEGTFWSVFVCYGCFRFMLGGSSFDIYYILALSLPIFAIRWLVGIGTKDDKKTEISSTTDLAGNRAGVA